jgi:hypothetical protein
MFSAEAPKPMIRLCDRCSAGLRAFLCVVALAGLVFSTRAETAEERESALKAAFLFNFFSYVQWPSKANEPNEAPFIVGVIGDSSLDPAFAALSGKLAKGRRIEVRKLDDLSKIEGCHLIFITASEEKRVGQILEQTKNHAILTVGESSGFTREGGMINLVPLRNRYQLEINPDAAEKVGLTLSSQLLKLARIVKT